MNNAEFKQYIKNGKVLPLIKYNSKKLTEKQLIEAFNIAIKNGGSYYLISYYSELLNEKYYKLCLQNALDKNCGYDLFTQHNEKLRSKEDRKLCLENALDNDNANHLLAKHFEKLTEEEVEYIKKYKDVKFQIGKSLIAFLGLLPSINAQESLTVGGNKFAEQEAVALREKAKIKSYEYLDDFQEVGGKYVKNDDIEKLLLIIKGNIKQII